MSAIATYRTAILALLTDAGLATFSNNDVDAALKWALAEYSLKRPLIRTYQFDVISTTSMHVMPADFITRHITKVELYDADPDNIIELPHYAFIRDEQWLISTRQAVEAGETLQVSYSAVHTIDGLDSAAGTTVPDSDEPLLQQGGAGHACLMRARNRIETINMNPDVLKQYREVAADFLSNFIGILINGDSPNVSLPEFPSADKF
jgi:hypothetical protein